MIPWFYHLLSPDAESMPVIFRAAMAALFAFVLVLAFGARIIRWLITRKLGDNPEFHNQTLNELTKQKTNTPTMGGIALIGAILVSTLIMADVVGNFYVRMALFCLVYLAILGGVDDWLKLTQARRNPGSRDGLYAYEKLLFQVGLGVLLALFIYYHPAKSGSAEGFFTAQKLNWPFLRDLALPAWVFAILTVVVITGSSNAVNLTDGMDGLAAGCMTIVCVSFMLLSYVTGDTRWSVQLELHHVTQVGELAVVCGAMAGACLGFLWFNCNPALVFMGDTGSLSLGGVIGYVAIVIRQEHMLFLVGGIFVLEAVSVLMQVSYFRFTGGKRIFLCTPIHHHFHMKGWTETQTVVRFWLICALCSMIALATIRIM
ncbi:MAG: phospho-N-acetylmuramoyl-pentapeptide-transferase [Phycisphaerae bacterium]